MSDPIVLDTVSPQNLTLNPSYQGVLAYRDGLYRWPATQVQRFVGGGKLVYPISVVGMNPHLAQIVDCERFDTTPAEAADWAIQRNDLHNDATVYVGLASVPELLDELGMTPCWLWVADWTGVPEAPVLNLPPHVRLAAVQFSSSTPYDRSAIMSSAWPASPWKDGVW